MHKKITIKKTPFFVTKYFSDYILHTKRGNKLNVNEERIFSYINLFLALALSVKIIRFILAVSFLSTPFLHGVLSKI